MIGVTSPAKCCCDEAPNNICIRMITYKFLCCETRTYLFVSSPCPIDAIRVNGTTIATPGTNQFGGWPSTTPTITIGEDVVSGEMLNSTGIDCCDNGDDPETETPYAIGVAAPTCTYNVEVDTCGETYTCSTTYCLQRQVTLSEMDFPGYSSNNSCTKTTELGTTVRTATIDLDPFTIPDFSIDNCIVDEDGQIISIGGWTGTTTDSLTLGGSPSSSTTVEYSGTLSLSIPANSQCVFDTENFILFSGTRTTTTVNAFGTFVSTDTLTNFNIAVLHIYRCNDVGTDPYITWGFCETPIDDGGDGVACDCIQGPIVPTGQQSWCG